VNDQERSWKSDEGMAYPKNLNWCQGEHGKVAGVFESKTNEQRARLGNVLGKQVQDEFLDIVEHASTFFNSVDDGSKVIICEYNVRSIFCDIRTGLAHGNADVCALERRRIVDTITSLESC
jgi:hypothetical protein